jgi:hypothetical protein
MMRLSSKALAETEGLASADTSPWIGESLSGKGLAPGGTERNHPFEIMRADPALC